MLSNEIMGVLALSIVWLNTSLIAASAWSSAASLRRLSSELEAARSRGELVRARILRGAGQGGAIAERLVQQIGRAMTTRGPDRIRFTDRRSEARIVGGEVEIDGARVELAPGDGQVWTAGENGTRDPAAFDTAWSRAGTNRGVECDLVIGVASGDVWLRGQKRHGRWVADLLATRCPVTEIARGRRALVAFALGSILTALGLTAVCLVPPVFGTVSTVGAAAMIAFFILVQPLGVMVRDAARLPPDRPIGGVWQRPVS